MFVAQDDTAWSLLADFKGGRGREANERGRKCRADAV